MEIITALAAVLGIPVATLKTIGLWIALIELVIMPIAHAIVRRFPTAAGNQVIGLLDEILNVLNPLSGVTNKLVPSVEITEDGAKTINGKLLADAPAAKTSLAETLKNLQDKLNKLDKSK